MAAAITPRFIVDKLREPERLKALITSLTARNDEYAPVAAVANMMMSSSATNDYLEKIGAEAIGGVHSNVKLGPDGYLGTDGIEVKPKKQKIGESVGGVINDDTPMKLVKDTRDIKWIVFLNAEKDSSRINYAVVAPFRYWNASRFDQIVRRLGLMTATNTVAAAETWPWGTTIPNCPVQRERCFNDLVSRHQERVYVRSSPLSLDVLLAVPPEERNLWVHPDVPHNVLPRAIRSILT